MRLSRLTLIGLVTAMAVVLSTITVLALRWVAAPSSATPTATASGPSLGFTRLNRPAPPLSLPSLGGSGTISLASVAGRPIVLNFWSSSCGPCKSETPDLASVARSLRGKVTFLGVDTGDVRSAARAFAARYGVPYQNAFDPNTTMAIRYDVVGLPATFFLTSSGDRILGENLGALTPASLRTILRELYHIG